MCWARVSARTAEGIAEAVTDPAERVRRVYEGVFRHADLLDDAGELPGFTQGCTRLDFFLVAMLRTAGVPARIVPGIRVAASAGPDTVAHDVTDALSCRLEYDDPSYGWVLSDPLGASADPICPDGGWIGLNRSDTVTLRPEAKRRPPGLFGMPYAESRGRPLDLSDPETARHTLTARRRE